LPDFAEGNWTAYKKRCAKLPPKSIEFFALCGTKENYRTYVLVRYQGQVMNFTVLLLCIICFFRVSAVAEENRWYLYYTDPERTEHYYDTKNIISTSKVILETQKTSPKRRVPTHRKYIKLLVVKLREKLIFNNPKYPLKESRILREFDCSKNMIRTLMVSDTYKNGFKKIEGKTQAWENISSKPSYEALYEIVCKP
jgi:hypothetical protein